MIRRKEPATEMELQRERREKRLLAYLIGIPALLLLTFTAVYFTPWEISYRQHGAAVLRAGEALPPYNTDRLQQVNSVSQHGVTVTAYYSRNELCAPVLDYYRQIAPTHG
jgi:hypothetical protein